MRYQLQSAIINEMVSDQDTQKVSYKYLDIYQVVASFYNCAACGNLRRAFILNPEFNLMARHHFVTADTVKEGLIETPLNPGPEGIEIRNIKIKDVARFIGIIVENTGDLIVTPYGVQYGQDLPNKIITVLQFFRGKNKFSLDDGKVKTLLELSADAVSKSRNCLYSSLFGILESRINNTEDLSLDYQLNLYHDVKKLLWENFTVDDVTFMSITPLYKIAMALSVEKGGIYNKLNMALRSLGKKMDLADPTPDIEDRFTKLRKDITRFLNNYQNEKSQYKKIKGCELPSVRYS